MVLAVGVSHAVLWPFNAKTGSMLITSIGQRAGKITMIVFSAAAFKANMTHATRSVGEGVA